MNLESNTTAVSKSQKETFEFLTDLKNFKQLLPENTEKFEIDGASMLFSLKGMPEIRMVIKETQEFDKVILGAASSKLPFTLTADIKEISETSSETKLSFTGDFNPMMAMMVKKPLQKFIDTLSENIAKL
ncbi:MAG: orotate phosphoribosyltransferase [Flavobacteriaceae bacterium]|nr:MAG: orotate phosphoribosyltransferase [Flavobacteriaceae bacterium]